MLRVVAVAMLFLLAAAQGVAAPDRVDVTTLSPDEIRTLQQRLVAAKCFEGPADGEVSAALKNAVAKCPDQRPQLRIETGFHIALIGHIGVDAQCRLAATASDDKTLRLWSLPDGRPLRVLRWPIGAGHGGKVNATAVSPDGRFVAAGGWDAGHEIAREHAIVIFDAASGDVVARIEALPNVVIHLAFSRDGRWLTATLGSNGVRAIDTRDWRIVGEDKDYGGDSYGAAFGPDDRLYTTSLDHKIRRYAPPPSFAKELEVTTQSGKEPYGIAVDPAGDRIAVGMTDLPGVAFYDAQSLKFRAAADVETIDNGDTSSVAWRSDGRVVFAGGTYARGGKVPVLSFDRDGRLLDAQLPDRASNTIMDLQPCGKKLAVAAFDPAFGLFDRDGKAPLWRSHVKPDLRDRYGDGFTISSDSRRLRFGLKQWGEQPVLFDLGKFSLRERAEARKDFLRPKVEGLPVKKWKDGYHPKFAGKSIALEDRELSRSLAILPKAAGFVLGTEWSLRRYDAEGRELWTQPTPEIVWGVNVSADGRIIVAAYGDGTIRWHRAKDGKELLALFVNAQTKEWVVWTPSGYYTASLKGEDMIGWHLNRGWDQAADFYPASKFRDVYARPDIVSKVLDRIDEGEAISRANAERTVAAPRPEIAARLPPVLTILSPKDGEATLHGEAVVSYLLRSPSGLEIEGIEADVGGAGSSAKGGVLPLDAGVRKCLAETKGLGVQVSPSQGCKGEITVHVPAGGESTVNLFARAGDAYSAIVALRLTNADEPNERTKPILFVLAVGVSHYDDHTYNLKLADKDATDFASALMRQKGGELYEDVQQRSFPDGDAGSVRKGLQWLTQSVTDRDVGMIFFAGHGAVDNNQEFYFLAADSRLDDLSHTAISGKEIKAALKSLRGSPVLFLDACHAGAVGGERFSPYNTADVVNGFSFFAPRALIYVSSKGAEPSREDPAWGNGAFTHALLDALKGGADYNHDGKISPSALDLFLATEVRSLTKDQQHPQMQKAMEVLGVLAESR
jgi:WD40 repeat protein